MFAADQLTIAVFHNMANTFFRFKQFTIHQDKCAMKVCTDACLFGAIVAAYNRMPALHHILDIGTGTGLLALMTAQKYQQSVIDAVETDEAAATQAASNFQSSPWQNRLRIHHSAIQQFSHSAIQQYQLIISNPPFYENSLRSDDNKRNLALHSDELSFEELIDAARKLIADDGVFAVLLPYARGDEFIELASQQDFFLHNRIDVKQTVNHNFFRTILFFNRIKSDSLYQMISIKNEDDEYTEDFKMLLAPYYLHL